MRKFYLMMCFSCLVVHQAMTQHTEISASSRKQSRSEVLTTESQSLKDGLGELEKKYNISIAYKDELVEGKNVKEVRDSYSSLDDALRSVLRETGLNYEKVSDRFYVIFPKGKQKGKELDQLTASTSSLYAFSPTPLQFESSSISLPGEKQDTRLAIQVTGKVLDENGNGFPGVNVLVKGTSNGTATDLNGGYSLTVDDENSTLVFTFIGYVTQEIALQGRAVVNTSMAVDSKSLDEVIVTALGIKKETKRLGYATSTVNNQQIAENRTVNFMGGLTGKMAGVNISSMGTGPAGTTKIRIRGQSSISAQNGPLIVVNGIPINNTTFGISGDFGGANAGGNAIGNADGGDGLSSINPDDIESMTVLKGGAAAALYGSRAQNGVIMITTKTGGSNKGWGVELNTNFTTDTPLDYTDYQYQYGQGEFGARPTTPNPTSGLWSFGEKFQPGMTQVLFDGVTVPYAPVTGRIEKFFKVGSTLTNTITVSNGGTNGGFNLSIANMDNSSIQPNSEFNRKTLNLGFNQKISEKLVITGNIAYSNEKNKNPPVVGGQDNSTPVVIYTLSNSMPFDLLSQKTFDPNGNEFVYSRFRNRTNPYISTYTRFENIVRDRVFGNVTAKYNLTDWLYVQGRIGMDYFARARDFNDPTGRASNPAAPAGFVNGTFTQEVLRSREVNADFLIGANKSFGKGFAIDATLGGNTRYSRFDRNVVSVQDFVVRNLYTVANGRIKDPRYDLSEVKINSLYAAAELSYNGYLYLNLTARNDWFSTLSPANRSILYPSANASFIFSQAFKSLPNWLSFGKIRAGYSEVGSDNAVGPYANTLFYGVNNNLFPNPSGASQPVGSIPSGLVPNANLKPSRVAETEFGLELKLFENRFGIDLTYYDKTTSDQILAAQISDATGYTSKLINIGRTNNSGIELLLTGTPIVTTNLKWDISFNFATNNSKVLDLGPGVTQIITGGGAGNQSLRQDVGGELNTLYMTAYQRDAQGNQVFGANGQPLRAANPKVIGTTLPKYYGGILNTITYKGIIVSALIDFKLGHFLGSQTNFNAYRHGLHQSTLVGREEGYVIGKGVNAAGQPNTAQTPLQTFYETVNTSSIREEFAYDAGFWKLRQLSIGYDFTKLLPSTLFIKGLKVSAVANNVSILWKAVPNIDPDQLISSSDLEQGLEQTGLPSSRSIGFNLNIKF
ncbi:SusC/RagA family TonB-linked outer membrane protein [soil metagenome]